MNNAIENLKELATSTAGKITILMIGFGGFPIVMLSMISTALKG